MTFDATVNPVVYEGGISVFIDTERDTWNMDPVALEKVFEVYPYVKVIRGEQKVLYISEQGKICLTEILETLAKYNVEGRPIWKRMHEQLIFRINPFITKAGNSKAKTNAYTEGGCEDVGMDLFERGLCLPSDNKMTAEQQNIIIEIIKSCFM